LPVLNNVLLALYQIRQRKSAATLGNEPTLSTKWGGRPKRTQKQEDKIPLRIAFFNTKISTFSFTFTLYLPDGHSLNIEALLNLGASACFLDTTLAQQAYIYTIEINPSLFIKLVNDQEISSELVTWYTRPLTLIF
ncbi:27876_t:CDS:2, partial [Gigaspora margarita]